MIRERDADLRLWSHRPAPARWRPRTHRAPVLAALAAVGLVVGVLLGPAAQAAGVQAPSTTVAPVPTTPAPAPPAEAADDPSTTSTTLAVVAPAGGADTGDEPMTDSEKAGRLLSIITVALVALAGLIAVATVVFWRRTSPRRVMAAEAAEISEGRHGAAAPAGPPAAYGWSEAPREPVLQAVGAGATFTSPATVAPGEAEQSKWTTRPNGVGQTGDAGESNGAEQASRAEQSSRAEEPSRAEERVNGLWASSGWGEPPADLLPPADLPPAPEAPAEAKPPSPPQPPRGYFDSVRPDDDSAAAGSGAGSGAPNPFS